MKRLFCLLLLFLLSVSALGIFSVKPAVSATLAPTFKSEAGIDGCITKWGRPYPPSQHTDASTSSDIAVGQWRDHDTTQPGYIYGIERGYVSFDTSTIPQNSQVNSVTLKLKTRNDFSTTDFVVQVWRGNCDIYAWNVHKGIFGVSLEASDWNNNATTLAATWNTVNYPGADQYIALQIPVEAIDKQGRTQFALNSSREGTCPTTDEEVYFYSGDSVGNEPILEVSYTEGTTLWNVPWQGFGDYKDAPINLSSTFVIHGLKPGYEMSGQFVTSIYQYQPDFSNPYYVNFRTALKFNSYVPKGSVDEQYNLATFQAMNVLFYVEKDTQGSGLDKQRINLKTDDAIPGYSEGYDLQQTTEIDSTINDRTHWACNVIMFCVGLWCEPIGIAWDLLDLATSFSPGSSPSPDYQNAGYADSKAYSLWNNGLGYLYPPAYDPIRQYCLNSWQWKQDNINPQSYYGLKIYARIFIAPNVNLFGDNYDPNQFTNWYIDTPPVYLRIGRSHSLSISSDSNGNTIPAPGTYHCFDGQSVGVTAKPYAGYVFDSWTLDGTTAYSNPIQVTMSTDHSLYAHFKPYSPPGGGGGGGGGCPYVYTWSGTNFERDNNILPASENGNGTDVKDYYLLQQPLVPLFSTREKSAYSLQIRELENNIDYIDQAKLIAVDHSQGTSIAVTQEGVVFAYQDPTPPISCVDNYGQSELSHICSMDGNVSDASTYFQGNKGDWLLLDFGKLTGPYANLILRDDMKCAECIDVQVPNARGGWQTVDVLNPRDFWSMEAVNMTAYIPKTGDFIVRLLWTQTHRLDYVGLDTSPTSPVKVGSASPVLAVHSTMRDVTAKLLYDDENCVELINGQKITLTFILPNKAQGTTRDFILYTDGYYYTITP